MRCLRPHPPPLSFLSLRSIPFQQQNHAVLYSNFRRSSIFRFQFSLCPCIPCLDLHLDLINWEEVEAANSWSGSPKHTIQSVRSLHYVFSTLLIDFRILFCLRREIRFFYFSIWFFFHTFWWQFSLITKMIDVAILNKMLGLKMPSFCIVSIIFLSVLRFALLVSCYPICCLMLTHVCFPTVAVDPNKFNMIELERTQLNRKKSEQRNFRWSCAVSFL